MKKYNLGSFSRRLLYIWCGFFETLIVESLFPEKIIETQSSVTVLGKRMCDFIFGPRMINKDQNWLWQWQYINFVSSQENSYKDQMRRSKINENKQTSKRTTTGRKKKLH